MNNTDKELTTRTLEKEIVEVDDQKSLNRFLDKVDKAVKYSSFIDYFHSLDKVNALTDSDLQKKSGIDRSYCYHVLDGSKAPGRDKILRLCIAAGLDETETRRALEAGKVPAFYSKSRRDAVIRFAIGKHLSVMDTNLLLADYELDPLA